MICILVSYRVSAPELRRALRVRIAAPLPPSTSFDSASQSWVGPVDPLGPGDRKNNLHDI